LARVASSVGKGKWVVEDIKRHCERLVNRHCRQGKAPRKTSLRAERVQRTERGNLMHKACGRMRMGRYNTW